MGFWLEKKKFICFKPCIKLVSNEISGPPVVACTMHIHSIICTSNLNISILEGIQYF